jgi:hypothetical protein
MQTNTLRKNSDLLGIISAGLCLIHCIALPVFLLGTLSAGLVLSNWHWLDFIFIALACVAVYFSTKKTASVLIKTGMWTSVTIFAIALLSHEISVYAQYISIAASVALMLLHFINIRHCRRCSVEKVKA